MTKEVSDLLIVSNVIPQGNHNRNIRVEGC